MEEAALLLVILPGVTIGSVDVELVAFHGELIGRRHRIRDYETAIVDADIARAGDAVIRFQLEVAWRASLPDDERVALDHCLRRDLAYQRSVLDSPVFRVAVPAGEGLAVK